MKHMIEKQNILTALECGEYNMKFTASDRIEEGTKYDGTKFYVFVDRDERPEINLGTCTIEAAGHTFVYNLTYGHWNGDDAALYEDKEIKSALESLEHFIPYKEYDNHAQWLVYAQVHQLDEDLPYYWYSEAPKDIHQLKGGNVEVPARYDYNIVPGAVKPQYRVLCHLNYADLAALYPIFQTHGVVLPEEEVTRLAGKSIEDDNQKLYNRVLNAVQKAIIEKGEVIQSGRMCIALRLTHDLFEEYLG